MAEREADLARVEAQVKSLRQVEAEQQNIIDKLAVGEAYGRVPVEGTDASRLYGALGAKFYVRGLRIGKYNT